MSAAPSRPTRTNSWREIPPDPGSQPGTGNRAAEGAGKDRADGVAGEVAQALRK